MRRTRTADQSSLFSFSFTATAKKRSEPSEGNFEEADEHSVEPVVNAMPHSFHSVQVPLVQQPSQSQSQPQSQHSIQSVSTHDCGRDGRPDDIGTAVLWPGGPAKVPADLKLRLLTTTMKPSGKASEWPSSVLSGKTFRITEFVFGKFNWLTFSEFHCGLYCKVCAIFAPEQAGQGPNQLGQLVTKPKITYNKLADKLGEHATKDYHKACIQKVIKLLEYPL